MSSLSSRDIRAAKRKTSIPTMERRMDASAVLVLEGRRVLAAKEANAVRKANADTQARLDQQALQVLQADLGQRGLRGQVLPERLDRRAPRVNLEQQELQV